MNTTQIKTNLYKLIDETDDVSVLDKIQAYFNMLLSKDVDWWDMLSDSERKNIEKGLKQLHEGKGIPHEQVRQEINKFLSLN